MLSASPLPIRSALPQLRAALATRSACVLQAPPGAGKSTGVPLELLHEPWLGGAAKIIMLEPRRLAARAVATRMASMLGEPVGRTVGYRTRLDTKVSAATRIEVVTEGILTRMLQRDAALEGVALVIFDEFHERSLQADLSLALCLDAQSSLREDLKVLVMSATLDGAAVAKLLGDAPIVTSQGQAFPVVTHYLTRPPSARIGQREPPSARDIAAVVLRALQDEHGDMLVFLPGQGEVRRVESSLIEAGLPRDTRVLPLYGDLPLAEQQLAIAPSVPGTRKVVLSTNIAETSLTIEGVRIVVDSGWARRARFDPSTAMNRLEAVRISRASADQRRGRAGRLEAGVCYRLWLESEHATLSAHTPAEILEADLAPLALELANWGAPDPTTLRWLDAPPAAAFSQARDLLHSLGALNADGRITAHGKAMAELGTHPRLAHLLLRAKERGFARLGAELAALLGERDLLRERSNVDIRARIDALHAAATTNIDRGARDRILRSAEILQRQLNVANSRSAATPDTAIGELLALAYPDRIAYSRGEVGRYVLSNGRGAHLREAQSLSKAEFLAVAELDAGEREAVIQLAAPLSREYIETEFAALIQERERIEWDSREQAVIARRERWLGAIKIQEQRLTHPYSEKVLAALLTGIRELGPECLPWNKDSRSLQTRIEFARRHEPDASSPWPNVSDAALLDHLEDWFAAWLTGMTRRADLARLDLHAVLLGLLSWAQQQRLDEIAPTHLDVPSGSHLPIDYSAETPKLAVRLQEVFGWPETPRIAAGRVPVLLELLSPAHRPVQVTQDLASFWERGYHDVRKDLKGRYPKHYWPDDPKVAVATARAKPRR